MATPGPAHARVLSEGARVTPLELFFGLVFVYAITQVTQLMADDPTGRGVLRGMLLLAILWWCWCCYSWFGNRVQADEGMARPVLFAVMIAMLVAAVTIPEAFNDIPGGLSGPVVFMPLVPAYVALGALTAVCIGWIAFEVWRYGVARREIREHVHHDRAFVHGYGCPCGSTLWSRPCLRSSHWTRRMPKRRSPVARTGWNWWRTWPPTG